MGTKGKNGGKRPGAGRKGLKDRKTKGHVKRATERLDKIQPRCVEVLEEAMEATKIVKDGEDSWSEIPDHYVRTKAAAIALAKRIPDLNKITHEGGDEDKPIRQKMLQKAEEMTNEELLRELAARAKG